MKIDQESIHCFFLDKLQPIMSPGYEISLLIANVEKNYREIVENLIKTVISFFSLKDFWRKIIRMSVTRSNKIDENSLKSGTFTMQMNKYF